MPKNKPIIPPGPPSPVLARAVRRMLRPLVSLLIQHGFTYSWLVKNLKPIFLDVAASDFKLENKPLTDSRISLLTGLDRKDIRNLKNHPEKQTDISADTLIGAQLVSIWMTDPRFLDGNGDPAPLPRLRTSIENPDDPSFEELFSMVTKSIKPRVFLDEWLRNGAASIDDSDRVCIELDSFVSNKTFEDKIFFLETNIHDHLAAAADNIAAEKPRFPDRSIYFRELSRESAEQLLVLSREEGMAFLKSVNRKAQTLQKKDRKSDEQAHRMHLGFYFYSEMDDEDA